MKHLPFILIFLTSCASHQPNDAGKIAIEVFDAFNAHDWARMESLISDHTYYDNK